MDRTRGRSRSSPPEQIAWWLEIDGAICALAAPGDSVAGVGRIGAIVALDGGWVLLDDKGATLLILARGANGALLFARKMIFEWSCPWWETVGIPKDG